MYLKYLPSIATGPYPPYVTAYQLGTIRKMFVTTTGLQGLLFVSELIIPVGGGEGAPY